MKYFRKFLFRKISKNHFTNSLWWKEKLISVKKSYFSLILKAFLLIASGKCISVRRVHRLPSLKCIASGECIVLRQESASCQESASSSVRKVHRVRRMLAGKCIVARECILFFVVNTRLFCDKIYLNAWEMLVYNTKNRFWRNGSFLAKDLRAMKFDPKSWTNSFGKNRWWQLLKFDIFISGQNHFDFTLKHYQTSFSGPIWPYTNFEEIWNFDPKP